MWPFEKEELINIDNIVDYKLMIKENPNDVIELLFLSYIKNYLLWNGIVIFKKQFSEHKDFGKYIK